MLGDHVKFSANTAHPQNMRELMVAAMSAIQQMCVGHHEEQAAKEAARES
jgi:hypothetical protein